MTPTLTTRAKRSVLALMSRLTGRHAVLLPAEAARTQTLLRVSAPYRVDGMQLVLQLQEPGSGVLSAELLGYAGYFPTQPLWTGAVRSYDGPCALRLDFSTGVVALADREWGRIAVPLPMRRFCWRLQFTDAAGVRRTRMTGHYTPAATTAVGTDYYRGDNYVDHEAQSAGGHDEIVTYLRRHNARGPVLEIGCATGGLLAALQRAGFAAVGVDASDWAVQQVSKRLGVGHAWVCDVEHAPLPSDLIARRPFGALVLASVLEHFEHPFRVLARLSELAGPGTILVVTTTNADSLTHVLFGTQWEGYFDATHRGIDAVSVRRLRAELPGAGWRIAELRTERIWDGNADPVHATLRDWWDADARFRQLLTEHDRGDLITCVAIKE